MVTVEKINLDESLYHLIHVELPKIKVTFLDYGATIYDIKTANKNHQFESIILQYETIKSYIDDTIYLNKTIGPLSGRYKNGVLHLPNQTIYLDKNEDNQTNLHGGKYGLSNQLFTYSIESTDQSATIRFTYVDDSTNIYRGIQEYRVTYIVYDSTIQIVFEGTSTNDVVMNLTNHAYFNLSGNLKHLIDDHELTINATHTLQTDEQNVPVKKIALPQHLQVYETKQVKDYYPEGLDHQFVLKDDKHPKAMVFEPTSGRLLEVFTTNNAIVCYTHNYPGRHSLKNRIPQRSHQGICLEAQSESNGINVEEFASSIITKESPYYQEIIYRFSVKEENNDHI